MSETTVELADRHSTAKRLALILIGLFVLIWPIWDLWPGITSVSVMSPIFWIIGLGAMSVGMVLIAGSVLGWSTVLTVAPDGLVLTRENLLLRRVTPLETAELGAIRVEEHEWSDGPATWRVSLALKSGKPLRSGDFQTRAGAEELALQLGQALGRAPY